MFDLQVPKIIGSPGLYLKSFVNNSGVEIDLPVDCKCNFELNADGLILHFNFFNQLSTLYVDSDSIIEIRIIQDREEVNLRYLSVMRLLLKLAVPLRYARYFKSRLNEYSIDNMQLEFISHKYEFMFQASGYLFEEHCDFFRNSEQIKKVVILRNSNYQK
jgi:hypothetical protein